MSKEAVAGNLIRRTENTKENLSQDRSLPNRESNPGFSEH